MDWHYEIFISHLSQRKLRERQKNKTKNNTHPHTKTPNICMIRLCCAVVKNLQKNTSVLDLRGRNPHMTSDLFLKEETWSFKPWRNTGRNSTRGVISWGMTTWPWNIRNLSKGAFKEGPGVNRWNSVSARSTSERDPVVAVMTWKFIAV